MRSATVVCIVQRFFCKYNAREVVICCPDGLNFVNGCDEDGGGGYDGDTPLAGIGSGGYQGDGGRIEC